MKILLGTQSDDKYSILVDFLNSKGIQFEIIKIKADSEIPEQPLNKDLTTSGSFNRAQNAIKNYNGEFDYAIGMEGGLEKINNVYNLVCAVTVINKKEDKTQTTQSDFTSLPQVVSQMIDQGKEYGVVIREYAKQNGTNDTINELITRKNSFIQALELQNFYKSVHF